MHRIITRAKRGEYVDHKNGDKRDNRRSNIRVCTPTQNNANQRYPVNNTSGYKGVSWHSDGIGWQAKVYSGGKFFHLGIFKDAKDAARAYNEKALELWGEFAWLNKV